MSFSLFKYVYDRGLVRSRFLGLKDNIYSSLYSTFAHSQVTDSAPCDGLDWGAVFGFGFSPDGSLLAAACENKCMLLYDPNNARLIQRRFKTHTDCVNCVRFLDNRTFATCSDDTTVRLWDARFLSSEVRILRGHSSWVKNIEYSCGVGKLITSGFDGNIFGWDINNYSENEKAEPLFSINGIMRTKITPDENKMIVSTMGGYFLLINDLELHHLKEDLSGFNPHHYWLMQLMNPPFHNPLQYSRMFTRKRNRVEFMCDFPDADDAESISTMQVHPQGWCIASRNTSVDEESEWTCVHDIQNIGNENQTGKSRESASSSNAAASNDILRHNAEYQQHTSLQQSSNSERDALFQQSGDLQPGSLFNYPPNVRSLLGFHDNHNGMNILNGAAEDSDSTSSDDFDFSSNDSHDDDDAEALESRVTQRSPANNRHVSSSDTSSEELSNSSMPNSEYSPQRPNEISMIVVSMPSSERSTSRTSYPGTIHRYAPRRIGFSTRLSNSQQNGASDNSNDDHAPRRLTLYDTMTLPRGYRVRQSVFRRNVQPRLLFYSEEPNIGRGFIKEQSFSADGRVIASPFGNCVRLLAFNSQCSELCDSVPVKPRALTQVGLTVSQQSSILASTFSPNHCMFVAGARDGSISFCSPKL